MKLLLVGAFLCIGLASGAHIRRLTRETEAVIPQLVETILKAELQSDLKQNKIEVAEMDPLIKKIADEVVVEKMLEEGKPVIVEIVKEEPVLPVLKSEPLAPEVPAPVIKEEKIEVVAIKDNLDTFRDEATPMIAAPAEPIKEAVIAEVKVEEAKMEQPMAALRNVVKEEIPQIEELRNIPVADAVKESIPEPVVALTVAEPVLVVEEAEKIVAVEPVLKKLEEETVVKAEKTEVIPEKVEIVEEKKEETLAKKVPEIAEPEAPHLPLTFPTKVEETEKIYKDSDDTPVFTEIKETVVEVKKLAPEVAEVKPVEKIVEIVPVAAVVPAVESEIPVVEMAEGEVRQNNPLQQAINTITQGVTSFASNIPIISNLVGNAQNSVAADAPADPAPVEAVADESATTARPQFPVLQSLTDGIQSGFQTLGQNVQNFGQNVVNSVQGAFNPNAASSSETAQSGGPLASLAQTLGLRPSAAAAAPAKDDDKPVEIPPPKTEAEKEPEAAKTAAVEVVEKLPEEKKPVEVVAPAIVEVVAPAIVEEKDSVKIEN